MRRLYFFMVLAVLFCCGGIYAAISKTDAVPAFKLQDPPGINSGSPSNYNEAEQRLFKFMDKHMFGNQGEVFTCIHPKKADKATLAESVGLLMDYAILRDRKDLFDREFTFLRRQLLCNGKYIPWKTGDKITCNAAIDDFRILRALMDASEKWGDKAYLDTAGFIQEEIHLRQIAGDQICEFYDWKKGAGSSRIPLCYLDLYTMYRLEPFDRHWSVVIDRSLAAMENGLMNRQKEFSAESPFFYKYYDYSSGRFVTDEEYGKTKGICLTYTLLTAIHLVEMNQDTTAFAKWLDAQMNKGAVFGWYNPQTLQPANQLESTAVYALAAVYAYKTGDGELSKKLLDKMLGFMVADAGSPWYGGFGNAATGEFHSFDNLTALWALALAGDR